MKRLEDREKRLKAYIEYYYRTMKRAFPGLVGFCPDWEDILAEKMPLEYNEWYNALNELWNLRKESVTAGV